MCKPCNYFFSVNKLGKKIDSHGEDLYQYEIMEYLFDDRDNYVVMSYVDYKAIEPMITRTGICPGSGKEITVTESINQPHYLSPLSESYWSA